MDQPDHHARVVVHQARRREAERLQQLVDEAAVLQQDHPTVGPYQHSHEQRGDDEDHQDGAHPATRARHLICDRVGHGEADCRRQRAEPQRMPDDAPGESRFDQAGVVADSEDRDVGGTVARLHQADRDHVGVWQDEEHQQHGQQRRDQQMTCQRGVPGRPSPYPLPQGEGGRSWQSPLPLREGVGGGDHTQRLLHLSAVPPRPRRG